LRNRVRIIRCPHQRLVPLPRTLDALAAVILHPAGRPDAPDHIWRICIDDHDDHDRGQYSSCRSDCHDLHVHHDLLSFAPLVLSPSVELARYFVHDVLIRTLRLVILALRLSADLT